jgi:adenine-specific DNA-methyltransferase
VGCSNSVTETQETRLSAPDDTLGRVADQRTIDTLVALAIGLGARDIGNPAAEEQTLLAGAGTVTPTRIRDVRRMIRAGHDPLGDAFCAIRSPEQRRPLGQTYTPSKIIKSMIGWAADQGTPVRMVDPGAGSGRFLLAAARKFRSASVLAADIDPLATLMLRANIAASGLADRATVHLGDYRSLSLAQVDGPTLYMGNPPYVRHHQIEARWKQWLLHTAAKRGLEASGLAGLHVHFFLATAEHGQPGDYGAFITSAEWLDVNYGRLVRQLLLDGLGAQSLQVLDPTAAPFADATTTGAITCFKIGDKASAVKVRRVESIGDLGRLAKGRSVSRQRLAEANRWSVLTRVTPTLPSGYIELGELCRVHRGTVTGANQVWVHRGGEIDLPQWVLFPSVTRARELFSAGERLAAPTTLRCVIDLPVDLGEFGAYERRQVNRFLRAAKEKGADRGYIATNRKAWWSVGLRSAAPVLVTYMARRPPAFVRNDAAARHINIAHGLYPRQVITTALLDHLASYLRSAVTLSQGRVYAGGLVKFEPKEVERIPVPSLESLAEGAFA